MSSLGGFESFIIGLAKRRGISTSELVLNLAYENELKLECLKILKIKGSPIDLNRIENCVHKLNHAIIEYKDLYQTINY